LKSAALSSKTFVFIKTEGFEERSASKKRRFFLENSVFLKKEVGLRLHQCALQSLPALLAKVPRFFAVGEEERDFSGSAAYSEAKLQLEPRGGSIRRRHAVYNQR
jgi:hypothetical protein